MTASGTPLKDTRLDAIANTENVAQFASFSAGRPVLRHARITGDPSLPGDDPEEAVAVLLRATRGGTVNVRSFVPGRDKGAPFHYGLGSASDACALVRALAAEGFYTIVNETIDVHDGGVSGVCLGGVVEFAPDDTPRAVEKPGTAIAPLPLAREMLRTVYGFAPRIDASPNTRLEFSLHPSRCGYRYGHTVWWELEDVGKVALRAPVAWPNRFSRHVGDKAFGLLVAHSIGLPVPQTVVIGRRVAPFQFGTTTGSGERWLRTCPVEQVPGRFTTLPQWSDPFTLLASEDPTATAIAAVIAQDNVDAVYSGATLPAETGRDHVEGVKGAGDRFMMGQQAPEPLPEQVVDDVRAITAAAAHVVGPVRIEWAHDGQQAWVLQMHNAAPLYVGEFVISPGDADVWLDFDISDGLERLRAVASEAASTSRVGVAVHGRIGLTSHVGDILRKARVPARLIAQDDAAD